MARSGRSTGRPRSSAASRSGPPLPWTSRNSTPPPERPTFARGIGLPGRVWASAEPSWIPDVVQDLNFPRAPVAAREGLHGALGFPILLRGDVVGVMEFFSREIRAPDADLLSMLTSIGNQIGLFVDRRRAQEELDRFFMLSLDMLCIAGIRRLLQAGQPRLAADPGLHRSGAAVPAVHGLRPSRRSRGHRLPKSRKQIDRGEEVIYFENRYFHKDGTLRWLMWTSTPFHEQQVVFAAARDITERKAAEETMASYARELEASQRELEDQAARLAQLVKELEVCEGQGRRSDRGEERVPRQHEPRDSHARSTASSG